MKLYKTHDQYRQAWSDAYTIDPPVPLNIDIELASVCNLACPFCFWGEDDFNKDMAQASGVDGMPKKRLMNPEMAFNIIQECAELGVPALKFNWRGESTIHPNYSDILTFARTQRVGDLTDDIILEANVKINNDKSVTLKTESEKLKYIVENNPDKFPLAFHDLLVNTNANCRDHAIPGLMSATKVMVSLDSTVPETYKKMRVGGDLSRAIEVINELVRRGHPNIWVRRVVTNDNKHEKFAFHVKQLFGDKVKVSEHACFDRNVDEHHQTMDPLRYERTYCGYPSQRMMIASDGSVYPCCVDYDGTMVMGQYPKQGILEIWSGEKFRRLRHELRRNQFESEACKNCTSWMSYKSINRDLVQDKEMA